MPQVENSMSTLQLWLLTLFAFLLTVANAWWNWNYSALNYDEGDYYRAVAKGFVTNWMDIDEIPITTFVSQGVKAVRGEISRGELSRVAREHSSAAFLRHYHSPVALYPAVITRALLPDATLETQLRLANIIWMVLWLIIFATIATSYPAVRSAWFVLVPASASWAVSLAAFNMHVLFGLSISTFALLWYIYEQNQATPGLRRLAIFFLALAIVSVEYSLFVWGAFGLWGIKSLWTTDRSGRHVLLRRWMHDALWLLGCMLVLWPAGVINLGILKSYVMQAYIGIFRLGAMPSLYDSVWDMFLTKWNPSLLELVVAMVLLLGIVWRWRELWRRGSLFVSFVLVMMIIVTQLSPKLNLPWYLFPLFAIVYTFYCNVLATRLGLYQWKERLTAVITALVFIGVTQVVVEPVYVSDVLQLRDTLLHLPKHPIVATHIITPQLSAYLPDWQIEGVHLEELSPDALHDSLEVWSHDHILILPKTMSAPAHNAGVFGDAVVYIPAEE